MKNILKLGVLFSVMALFSSCEKPVPMDLAKENLIPKPSKLTATGRSFELEDETVIYTQKGKAEVKKTGAYLARFLKPSTGYDLEVKDAEK